MGMGNELCKISNLRNEYRLKSLDINTLNPDPFMQFFSWFEEAERGKVDELNAMALATVSENGYPSCRMVLLKQMDSKGFSFFTNYESKKGKELERTPFASAVLYWRELERQIILEGKVKKLSSSESTEYFSSRPRNSQLGAWASHQDQILSSREELQEAYHHFEKKFEGKLVPMPPYWGGYRLIPNKFEFWQGRESRLHDRFCYILENNVWCIYRLAP
jgi:pyridoxamine 5'-phosphate oxidase